jgi:hypothetical protein
MINICRSSINLKSDNKVSPSQLKPKQVSSVEIANQKTRSGTDIYLLHNPDTGDYLELDSNEYFMWSKMDGTNNIVEIVTGYFMKFGEFPEKRFLNLYWKLRDCALLEGNNINLFNILSLRLKEKTWIYRLKRISDEAFQRKFSIKQADRLFSKMFLMWGWFFFMKPVQIIMAAITILGFVCIMYLEFTNTGTESFFNLINSHDSYGTSFIIIIILTYFMIFCQDQTKGTLMKSMTLEISIPSFGSISPRPRRRHRRVSQSQPSPCRRSPEPT